MYTFFKKEMQIWENYLVEKERTLQKWQILECQFHGGFTITTESCNKYYSDGEQISEKIQNQIYEALSKLENQTGKTLGSKENPLLVSVRSGARASMPGMMDTILNLGINDEVVENLAKNKWGQSILV